MDRSRFEDGVRRLTRGRSVSRRSLVRAALAGGLAAVLGRQQVQAIPRGNHDDTGGNDDETGGEVRMYLRIARAHFDPSIYEEVVPVFQDLEGAMRRMPGLYLFVLGIDRETGTAVAVSTWDIEEHTEEAREVLSKPLKRLQALEVRLDPPEVYEILES
jgi:quinol monooxygenase YgiN